MKLLAVICGALLPGALSATLTAKIDAETTEMKYRRRPVLLSATSSTSTIPLTSATITWSITSGGEHCGLSTLLGPQTFVRQTSPVSVSTPCQVQLTLKNMDGTQQSTSSVTVTLQPGTASGNASEPIETTKDFLNVDSSLPSLAAGCGVLAFIVPYL
eukprot:Blabericola_migrator_1__5267@NODE_2704_length_2441_cov_232_012637_g1691_i0_p2_GENE_NODE_2704_length_2441_cov_232_012637_g1691_i0NODE_2704_length_2441_cov_232_012637_g1691_i0_p2_ORF_typecomplete_len158_score20_99REJ/PF02010_15/0_0037MG1/PF17790_1/2e03MG1/PF17790_1/0_29Calxbeta/PF03160_14/9_8e02Calxbeta/PF03160_14/0_13_NODE_2704_length_2441_cov_232_012637_g1691_i010681541